MKRFVAVSFVLAVIQGNIAWAQSPTAGEGARSTPRDQEFTFRDEIVQGALVRPNESTLRGNRRMRGISLLRIRQHFVQEINESVENL